MPTPTKTPRKNAAGEEAATFGTAPRPKYEVPLNERPETLDDAHSRSTDAESPYLEDFIPGSARG